MPAVTAYPQYCPIARALDVLGDRWTLLVLRELTVAGDLRFTDLRAQVRGITATVLTDRLRRLVDEGLVTTRELPPPAARSVYSVTERGREAVPVLRALARFGAPLLETPPEDRPLRPANVLHGFLLAFRDHEAARGVDERYVVVIDGQRFDVDSLRDGDPGRRDPDLVVTTSARTLVELRRGALSIDGARTSGELAVEGSAASLGNFVRMFRLSAGPAGQPAAERPATA